MQVQWVYSTNLKDNRYPVICFAVLRRVQIIDFIVGTGAMFTRCNYTSFDINLSENDLIGNETKLFGGFVKGSPIKFYKYSLSQFTIGNIGLGKQDIWIIFDERVTDTVLGMDILQQVIFTANSYNKKIYFFIDRDDYNNNFELLTA